MPDTGEYIRDKVDKYLPTQTKAGLIQQVNFISKFYMSPCAPRFAIYAEAFFPALLEAVIAWRAIDEGDFIRTLFRPKGLKRGGHLRGGRGKGEWTRRVAIATTADRAYTSGVKNLWIFDTFVQRALFWVSMVDIASDFLYNFHALMLDGSDCGPGSAQLAASPGIIFTLGGWDSSRFPTVIYDSLAVSSSGNGFVFNTGAGFASAGVSVVNTSPLHSTLVRVRVTSQVGSQFDEDVAEVNLNGGESATLAVQVDVPKFGIAIPAIQTSGLGVPEIVSGDAYASSFG